VSPGSQKVQADLKVRSEIFGLLPAGCGTVSMH
jgi:hypothetical protein